MTGNTHMAVGVASALALSKPSSYKEMILCIGIAAIGAVISDVDVSTSKSHKKLDEIIFVCILTIVATIIIEKAFNIGIVSFFIRKSNLLRLIVGFFLFIFVCLYGMKKPHRTFMHSFIAVTALGSIIYIVHPFLLVPFVVSMLSHILIDMFNYKKVNILYPLKSGIAFNLCKADGLINKLLFILGIFSFVILTIINLIKF